MGMFRGWGEVFHIGTGCDAQPNLVSLITTQHWGRRETAGRGSHVAQTQPNPLKEVLT